LPRWTRLAGEERRRTLNGLHCAAHTPLQEKAMMTSELRYLLKTNSDCDACSDQESLSALLADLREVAHDLDLDFGKRIARPGSSRR
jgi:hypothetical protein